MGCFPPALLTTIKDATDRRVGCSSSPALRSASLPAALAMEGLGHRALPCGTAAPRLPARAGRKHLRLLQCSAAGASRLVPGKPCSPGFPCHPTAGSAGVGTCSPRQRWWVRRQGERGGLWSWSAEHDARAHLSHLRVASYSCGVTGLIPQALSDTTDVRWGFCLGKDRSPR